MSNASAFKRNSIHQPIARIEEKCAVVGLHAQQPADAFEGIENDHPALRLGGLAYVVLSSSLDSYFSAGVYYGILDNDWGYRENGDGRSMYDFESVRHSSMMLNTHTIRSNSAPRA